MSDTSLTIPAGVPAIGEVIAAKYRVERVLGIGGMGVVLEARHIKLEETVAIKVLLPELARNQEVVERFLREARAAVRIKNEHVGRVFDVETLENGTPYMVMECLQGHDLSQLLVKNGPLALSAAADYLLQACEALAEAHALGIVHRDLKPSNLYLATRSDGTATIKVLDFGIAKIADGAGESMTKTNVQMGTPSYMAPEQLRAAKTIDARVDIWALGIVLYELLTDTLPFEGDSIASIGVAVVLNDLPSVRLRRPELPPEVDALLARCLEKERDDRYPTIAALAEALAPFASPEGVSSSQRILRAGALGRPVSSPNLLAAIAQEPGPSAKPTVRGGGGAMPQQSQAEPSPSSPVMAVPLVSAPAAPMEKTNGAWQSETPPSPSRSKLWFALAGAALAGGLAVALLLRAGGRPTSAESAVASPEMVDAAVSAIATPPITSAATPGTTAPLASALTASATDDGEPSPAASANARHKSRSRPTTNGSKSTPTPSRNPKRETLPDIH